LKAARAQGRTARRDRDPEPTKKRGKGMNGTNESAKQWTLLVARVLLAAIFVWSGWGKIGNFAGTASSMAAKGIPLAELALVAAIVLELGGGVLLALGWHARLAAVALIVFVVPATLLFHAFWALEEAQVRTHAIQFMKNLCIVGGLFYAAVLGAGGLSLDARRSGAGRAR
jgi:putative oxidoreductase